MLLAGSAVSKASAQDDPEQGLVGEAQVTESSVSADTSGGGGGGGGTTLSNGSIALWGGFRLGVGGGADSDPGGEDDLNATFGLQIGGEYVVWDYVAVGGELRWATLTTETAADFDQDRFSLIDVVVKPRGRYVIDKIGLEVYGTMPLGITFASMPDPLDGKAGFTLGIGAGAIYMFTDMIGINAEMAWYGHWFNAEGPAGLGIGDVDFDLSTSQFQLFIINAVFVL
jgi:hypothetical protein